VQSELTGISCPAPAPLSATPLSGTSVTVSFNRDLTGSTVDAGAFTITTTGGSLSVTDAQLSAPRTVSLTTGTQVASTQYTVVVGSSVTDRRGTGVSSSANTASFTGVAGNVCNPGLVISALYGGGGNSGATYTYDFIELKNRTGAAINLAGWSIQYGGTAGTSWTAAALTGTVPANGYFLVRGAPGATVTGVMLPTTLDFDAPTIQMGGTNGVIALVNSTSALTACPAAGAVADLVGYGSATCKWGTGTSVLSSTTGASRAGAGCTNTNANSVDFTVGALVAPRNSATSALVCTCP
jgi:hypothetical protein